MLPEATNTWPSTSVVIPSDTPPGIYHLCEKADDDVTGTYSVTESNEGNNWKCTGPTITVPKPDLYMSQVSNFTLSVSAGDKITVLDSLENNGGAQALAFDLGFVLPHNVSFGDGDDIFLPTNRSVDVLDVGAYSRVPPTP